MVRINMNKPSGRTLTPGIDLWEIVKASATKSRAGVDMLKIEFARSRKQSDRVFDNVMLDGPGWDIGKQKLGALLPNGFDGDLDPLDLIGKRVWLSTGVETYEGKDNLKVMIADLKFAGMQPEKDVPEGAAPPVAGPGGDIPF